MERSGPNIWIVSRTIAAICPRGNDIADFRASAASCATRASRDISLASQVGDGRRRRESLRSRRALPPARLRRGYADPYSAPTQAPFALSLPVLGPGQHSRLERKCNSRLRNGPRREAIKAWRVRRKPRIILYAIRFRQRRSVRMHLPFGRRWRSLARKYAISSHYNGNSRGLGTGRVRLGLAKIDGPGFRGG
jgi:hypothetical protein